MFGCESGRTISVFGTFKTSCLYKNMQMNVWYCVVGYNEAKIQHELVGPEG
jgi:hypothetical protein